MLRARRCHSRHTAITTGARAQLTVPEPGVLLRLTMRGDVIEGRLLSLENDSIHLKLRGGTAELVVNRAHVDKLEMSRRTRGHPWKGALIGAGVGALLQMLGEEDYTTCGETSTGCAAYGAGAGAVAGVLIGMAVRTRVWETVERD